MPKTAQPYFSPYNGEGRDAMSRLSLFTPLGVPAKAHCFEKALTLYALGVSGGVFAIFFGKCAMGGACRQTFRHAETRGVCAVSTFETLRTGMEDTKKPPRQRLGGKRYLGVQMSFSSSLTTFSSASSTRPSSTVTARSGRMGRRAKRGIPNSFAVSSTRLLPNISSRLPHSGHS